MERGRTYRLYANSYGSNRQNGSYRITVRYAQ
jgi:hypothetical protein